MVVTELAAAAAPSTPRFSKLTEEQKTLMKRNLLCVSIFMMPGLDEFPQLHVASVDSPSGVEQLVVLSDGSDLEVLEEELKGALERKSPLFFLCGTVEMKRAVREWAGSSLSPMVWAEYDGRVWRKPDWPVLEDPLVAKGAVWDFRTRFRQVASAGTKGAEATTLDEMRGLLARLHDERKAAPRWTEHQSEPLASVEVSPFFWGLQSHAAYLRDARNAVDAEDVGRGGSAGALGVSPPVSGEPPASEGPVGGPSAAGGPSVEPTRGRAVAETQPGCSSELITGREEEDRRGLSAPVTGGPSDLITGAGGEVQTRSAKAGRRAFWRKVTSEKVRLGRYSLSAAEMKFLRDAADSGTLDRVFLAPGAVSVGSQESAMIDEPLPPRPQSPRSSSTSSVSLAERERERRRIEDADEAALRDSQLREHEMAWQRHNERKAAERARLDEEIA